MSSFLKTQKAKMVQPRFACLKNCLENTKVDASLLLLLLNTDGGGPEIDCSV